MARKPIKQRIEFEGADKMQKDLAALGKSGEKAFADIQKAALKVDFTRLSTSLKRFGGELATFGKKISLAFAGFGVVGGLSFAGSAKALTNLAKSAGEVADQTGKAAQAAGLSTEAFSKLAFGAEQSDVSQEQLVTSTTKLNKQIAAAAQGNKQAVSLFSQFGVAIKDAEGRLRPTEDIIHDIADAFARMPNGVKKSTLAVQLFGRAGAALIPFLNEGKSGLLDLEQQAVDLGIALTDQQAKIGDALGDSLDKVSKASAGIRLQLGLVFAPTLTRAADLLTKRITANRQAIVQFGNDLANKVGPVIDDVINALSGNDAAVKNSAIIQLRDQTIQFGMATQEAVTGIVIPAFHALRDVLAGVARALNAVFDTNISGDALGIAIAIGSLTGAFKLLRAAIDVVLAGLFLLARHPVVAVLTAIAAGLVIVANRMRLGETATQAHQRALSELKQALDDVKNNVPGARERLNELARAHVASAKAALADAQAQVDAVKQELEIEKAKKPLGETFQAAQQQRLEQVEQALVEANVNRARTLRQLEEVEATIAGKSIDKIEDLRGKADDTTESVKKVGDAAAATEQKVESLGKTIKVTSFGPSGPVKQVFNIDETGAAHAAEGVSLALSGLTDAEFKAAQASGTLADKARELGIKVDESGDEIDEGADDIDGLGTAASAAAPKVAALNTSLKDTSTSVINVATALGQVEAGTTKLGTAADTIATQLTAAKGSADELFVTASNNSAGLTTVLDTTADSARGLGTALDEAATSASNLGSSFAGAEQSAGQVADALLTPFETVAAAITRIMGGVGGVVRTGFQALQSSIASAASSVSSSIERILSQLRAAAAAAARLQSQARGSGGGQAARAGFARGGQVFGPGTGTSDSIVARLSRGEFVVREAATRKFLPLLQAINSMRFDWEDLLPRGFSLGGLADDINARLSSLAPRMPHFADGGAVDFAPTGAGFGSAVHLHVTGTDGRERVVAIPTTSDAVAEVVRHANDAGITSGGRKPSWYGS